MKKNSIATAVHTKTRTIIRRFPCTLIHIHTCKTHTISHVRTLNCVFLFGFGLFSKYIYVCTWHGWIYGFLVLFFPAKFDAYMYVAKHKLYFRYSIFDVHINTFKTVLYLVKEYSLWY